MKFKVKNKICFSMLLLQVIILLSLSSVLVFPGCRSYDSRFDISYFFKTDPEKAALDFIYAMNNHDAEYIYNNLLLERDRRNISKEKFIREMSEILSAVDLIEVEKIVYLGYEDDLSKVVLEFKITYLNGDSNRYKKYIYLMEENSKWKIVFDKTFI